MADKPQKAGMVERVMARLGFERRGAGLNNPKFWRALLGGMKTAAGETVGAESAWRDPAFAAALRVLSQTFATIPCHLYEVTPGATDTGRRRADNAPLHDVLRHQANDEMTAYEYRERVIVDLYGTEKGIHYAEIETNRRGDVIGLHPLANDRMKEVRPTDQAAKEYHYTTKSGRVVNVPRDRLFVVPGLAADADGARSLLKMARESVGLSMALQKSAAAFFSKGMMRNGVLEMDKFIPKEDRDAYMKELKGAFSGAEDGMGLPLLMYGIKFQDRTVDPDKAQALESREFQIADMARFSGVQPHMLGDLSNAHHTNIEQQGLEFLIYTMLAILKRFEQRVRIDLVNGRDRGRFFAEHDPALLLQADIRNWSEAAVKLVNNGIWSPNEARRQRNLAPYEGGDAMRMPHNIALIDNVMAAGTSGGSSRREPAAPFHLAERALAPVNGNGRKHDHGED